MIYSIGYSTHKPEVFFAILSQYKIKYLIDVRKTASSYFNEQFSSVPLRKNCNQNRVKYLHLPELGGESLAYSILQEDQSWQRGIERIRKGNELGCDMVLMCAEGNPLDCHRFLHLSRELKNTISVKHILKDGSLIDQESLENKLMFTEKIHPDLFIDHDKLVSRAYESRLSKVYKEKLSRFSQAQI
jgi:uncharacterized protein (DUF488 family)